LDEERCQFEVNLVLLGHVVSKHFLQYGFSKDIMWTVWIKDRRRYFLTINRGTIVIRNYFFFCSVAIIVLLVPAGRGTIVIRNYFFFCSVAIIVLLLVPAIFVAVIIIIIITFIIITIIFITVIFITVIINVNWWGWGGFSRDGNPVSVR
jgi:hypothetical protein